MTQRNPGKCSSCLCHHLGWSGPNSTHNLHLVPIDLDWSLGWSTLPEVYDHFLGFGGVELQVVGVRPRDEVPYQAPVLLLLITPNTSHNGRVVGELLDVTRLRHVAEVRRVEGEEKGGQYRPLWCSRVADHSVRCDVLQPDVLWSAGEVVE